MNIKVLIRADFDDTLHISEPVVIFKYNTGALSDSIHSNGLITLEDLGISENVNYTSVIEDIASDKIRIRVYANALNEPDLFVLTEEWQPLILIKMFLPSVVDPGILLNQNQMAALSRYFDISEQLEKHFDCVKIEGELQTSSCIAPVISSMVTVPDLDQPSAAGVDLALVILGDCFGEIQGNSYVEFTNALTGPDPVEWVRPLPQDYFSWNNAAIGVWIPSIAQMADGSPGYAGTGKVRVVTDDGIAISAQTLQVDFSYRNSKYPNADIPPNHTLPVILLDRNEEAGYNLYYSSEFKSDSNNVIAFERALNTWRCNSPFVNFVVKDSMDLVNLNDPALMNLACRIDFQPLPVGVTSTLAETQITSLNCNNQTGAVIESNLSKFSLLFNSDLNWHTAGETPVLSSGTHDLESIALHELGHAQGLLHTNQTSSIMYWSETQAYNRVPSGADIQGAEYIFNLSQQRVTLNYSTCGENPMIAFDCNELFVHNPFITQHFILYPNPTNAKLHFDWSLIRNMQFYRVFNAMGEVVLERHGPAQTNEICTESLNSGFYTLLVVQNNGQKVIAQFIKID